MADAGDPFDFNYTRIIELIGANGTTVVRTLCSKTSDYSVVDTAEFEWLRQGGCGGGSFTIDLDFPVDEITAGQHIRCSYASGDIWYFGRIESVHSTSPGTASIVTYGLMSALAEIHVGGQAWWSTSPQTFGRYDYFTNDPDYAIQNYSYIPTMQLMIELLYNDYIAPWSSGLIGLGTIDARSDADSFASLTLRGGESLSEILRMCADISGGASYGVDADNNFFFVPLETSNQAQYTEGDNVDIERTEDRSIMFNRLIIVGGYVYGTTGRPNYYVWNSHHEDAASVASHGPKTLSVKIPAIRTHVEAANFATGFFSKHAGPTIQYTGTTTSQSGPLYPWLGGVQLFPASGTTWNGATSVSQTFDSCKVDFNESPLFTFTTGPEPPHYPVPEVDQAGEQSAGDAGGGGGGDAGKVSGWGSTIIPPPGSIDSCYWSPCEAKTAGFVVTDAHADSGYVVGDIYYSTQPVCPRTGVTFFDMENPIGEYVNIGDAALSSSDFVFRVGTATFMRRYGHYDGDCKWFITGLFCPPG